MSKGTPTRTVRISDAEWEEIETVVTYRNEHSHNPPWTMREFLVLAAREMIKKMARSRGRPLTLADRLALRQLPPKCDTPDLFSDKALEDNGANA